MIIGRFEIRLEDEYINWIKTYLAENNKTRREWALDAIAKTKREILMQRIVEGLPKPVSFQIVLGKKKEETKLKPNQRMATEEEKEIIEGVMKGLEIL